MMTTSIDLIRSCQDSIRQISDKIEGAVLYLDAGCLEAFRFMGAFPLLLELGVYAVCSLEDSSPLDITVGWNTHAKDLPRKIVIITSRLLSDAHRYILRCLSTHRTVLHCTIFTSVSEIAHSAYVDSPLGPDAFREYKSLLLQDYEELVNKCDKKDSYKHNESKLSLEGDNLDETDFEEEGWPEMASGGNYDFKEDTSSSRLLDDGDSIGNLNAGDGSARLHLSVDHFPMIMCPLSPRVFVLPSEGIVAEGCLSNDNEDSLSPGLPSISEGLPLDGEDVPPGLTLTANFLYHLGAKMDLKMEIFSLGGASKVIGKMLTDMSSLYDVGRRNKRAGLLIIDRTLDLLTPCSHGDSFLDRILSTLLAKDRALSSLKVKSSQNLSKHSHVDVQRTPLDATVPFGTIFSKTEPVLNQTQLSDCIQAFISGWDSAEANPEADDLVDHVDIVQTSGCGSDLLSGSFLSNHMGTCFLEELLNKRSNDGANLIKSWLIEALKREKIPLTTKGRFGAVTSSEVHDLVRKLSSNPKLILRNKGIIQMGLAAEIALSEPHSSRWDAFVSAEKILSINSTDTSQSLSSQLRDLINTSILVRSSELQDSFQPQGPLSFQDALLLAITGYILAGENFSTSGSTSPFSWEEEHSLKESVVDAILESPTSAKFKFLHGLEKEVEATSKKKESMKHEDDVVDDFDDQWGSWDDEDKDDHNEKEYGDMQLKLELKDKVDQLFKFLHKLSGLKWRYPALRKGLATSASNYRSETYARKGLLYKLLTSALTKHGIPGLEYHSSVVGRLFKSGLGRIGIGQANPSFGEQSVILVFVVGGINCLEAQEVMEAFTEYGRPDSELILGGTTLLTADDMFELLLGSSSYL